MSIINKSRPCYIDQNCNPRIKKKDEQLQHSAPMCFFFTNVKYREMMEQAVS